MTDIFGPDIIWINKLALRTATIKCQIAIIYTKKIFSLLLVWIN